MKIFVIQNPSGFEIPINGIILWYGNSTNVPPGFEIYAELQGNFAMGGAVADLTARGSLTHTHTFPNVETKANHTHTGSSGLTGYGGDTTVGYYASSDRAATPNHNHGTGINIGAAGGHGHTIAASDPGSSLPVYKRLYYIRKIL